MKFTNRDRTCRSCARLGALLLTGVMIATACGNDDDDASPASAVTPSPAPQASAIDGPAGSDDPASSDAPAATGTQATAAPAVSEATGPSEPGDPYQVVIIGSLTGPQGAQSAPIPDGIATVFDSVNAEGGVDGHMIEYSVLDDQSDTTTAQAVARSAINDEPVIILDGSSPTFAARLPLFQTAERPVFAANAIGIPLYPWLYGASATSKQLAAGLVNGAAFLVDGSLEGKRVAFAGIDSPATRAAVEDMTSLVEELGGTMTSAQFVPPGTPSFDSGAANIISEDVDVVMIQDAAAGTTLEARALVTAGFEGPIIVQYAGSDDVTLEAMGSEQVYGVRPYAYPVPGSPMFDAAEEFGHANAVTNEGFARGWIMAHTVAMALGNCEFPCPPEAMQAAMDGLGTYTVPGDVLQFGDLVLGPDIHHPLLNFGLYNFDPATGEVSAVGDEIPLGPVSYPEG